MARYKQFLVMRRDLALPAGKAIAQGAHAALWASKHVEKTNGVAFENWNSQGCTKIVVGVGSEEELLELADRLRAAGAQPTLVRDLGRTVLEAGTLTCLGVGPLSADVLDPVLKHLRLY
jgi:PTH2 family peptidyl-tRNA hydrolase